MHRLFRHPGLRYVAAMAWAGMCIAQTEGDTSEEPDPGARVEWVYGPPDGAVPQMLAFDLLREMPEPSDADADEPAQPGIFILGPEAPEVSQLPASFSLETFASELASPGALTWSESTGRWTTLHYARDAALLTPFDEGSRVVSWDLTDRVTLAGVGSPRVWDYRDRAFVVSAEAGFWLSPRAGLQMGYELLQTSAQGGLVSSPASGESLFARFQLRF